MNKKRTWLLTAVAVLVLLGMGLITQPWHTPGADADPVFERGKCVDGCG